MTDKELEFECAEYLKDKLIKADKGKKEEVIKEIISFSLIDWFDK